MRDPLFSLSSAGIAGGDIADLLKDPAQSLDAARRLGVGQEEVTRAAGSSRGAVSRLEQGTRTPQLPTLQRIAAVLDEELLVCFRRTVDGEVGREFAAVA